MNATHDADLEAYIESMLAQGRDTLGAAVPRLITQKPQVATNGLKHGLTGQSTFLSSTELSIYLAAGQEFILEMEPVGVRENHLLQRIIDTDWRLTRVPFLQENLLRAGEIREAEKLRTSFPGMQELTVEVYSQADSLHESIHDLDKLSRHETRLSRLLDSLHKEFERRQADRRQRNKTLPFDAATCKPLLWYTQTATAVEQYKATADVVEKYNDEEHKTPEAAPATPTESAAQKENLVCIPAPPRIPPAAETVQRIPLNFENGVPDLANTPALAG